MRRPACRPRRWRQPPPAYRPSAARRPSSDDSASRGDMHQRRHGARAGQRRRAGQHGGDVAVQADRVVQQQPAVAADRGSVAQPRRRDASRPSPRGRTPATPRRGTTHLPPGRCQAPGPPRSGRTGWSPAAAIPARRRAATLMRCAACAGAVARQRAIEPFRRLRRDGRPRARLRLRQAVSSRSPPATPPEVFSVTHSAQSDRPAGNAPSGSRPGASSASTVTSLAQPHRQPQLPECPLMPGALRRNGWKFRQIDGGGHPPRRAPRACRPARRRRGPSPTMVWASSWAKSKYCSTSRMAISPRYAAARSPGRYP